ncbi:Sec-independent protein translocase protein TatB [Rodentibacter myodis]|uniref:Sec-independent protein translocase protein TatB n=1 Tax=Rodentibacter myodis TaxID=1907939 RepID=A0A1V3JM55_9PAST|nr:Sec-independent protein translocase protein TatB [Rodentibacter myodis]OOF57745.1 twin arginine-targeting protein translocase TatB [Rodentibacter myodis]
MFDIGFSELVLLMIVGLVVLGPKRLPVAIRTVMGWVKTIRGLAANVQNELKQELKLQELQESIKKAEALNLQSLSPELSKTVDELKVQADKMRAELEAKAAEAGTTVEEQIKEMKSAVENGDKSPVSEHISSSNETQTESVETIEKTTSDLTALEAHEQAELTERLSDYYPPDDMDITPSSTPKSPS